MRNKELTILHIEDDPSLARLVRTAFTSFGFQGEILSAATVREAKDLLMEMERARKPLNLIISDMSLTDGTGLDVIHEVRTSSAWKVTPLIVLSGEANERIIGSAYALGANCYIPKTPKKRNPLDALHDLYRCWLENAWLPLPRTVDRLQAAVEKAIELRTRTSDFYLGLARASKVESDEMEFWLNCALNEGNLSNLAAFFRCKLNEVDIPSTALERLEVMQIQVKRALSKVERRMGVVPSPQPETAYKWALELVEALDEEVFAETFGYLFPVSPVATLALKVRAATHLQGLANHIMERTGQTDLRQRAGSLLEWSKRLATTSEKDQSQPVF